MIENVQKTNGKNGIIELFRFLFAIWVVYFHGWLGVDGELFADGYISVEFFFILSGFYLFKSFARVDDKPFFAGWWQFFKKRVCAIGLPLAISFAFLIWYKLAFSFKIANLFVYMWFVPYMFVAFFVAYALRRLIKNDVALICIFCVFVATFYYVYWGLGITWGIIRSIPGVSLGILISYIKPVVIKVGKINLNAVALALTSVGVFVCAMLPKPDLTLELILCLALFPILVYLLNTVHVKCKPFEFLGALSFSFYAYQMIPLVLYRYFVIEKFYYFIIICALSLITYYVNARFKAKKSPANAKNAPKN
jgi:peptidoglycan/LPS O-acetylase OafA/YrhL